MNPCQRPGQCTDRGFGPESCSLCNPGRIVRPVEDGIDTDPNSPRYMRRTYSEEEIPKTHRGGTPLGEQDDSRLYAEPVFGRDGCRCGIEQQRIGTHSVTCPARKPK